MDGTWVMQVWKGAGEEIDSMRLSIVRGSGIDMDAHALYTRLKVAAGLALLSGSESVSREDWELSGVVMKVSDRCRQGVADRLRTVAAEANVSRGRAEGVRSAVASATAGDWALGRVSSAVLRKIPADGWISSGKLMKKISAKDRGVLEEALSSLVSEGRVIEEEVVYRGRSGVKYRRI
jgi:hypothetical protein